jgi:hypothetical protein
MRNQAHSLMSLIMVAGVAAAGFIGACGGKVVVDASNPSGSGGAGGAGGSGPGTTAQGPIITGPITGPATTGPQTDVAVSVGPSSVSVGPGSVSSVSVGPGPSSVSVGPGPSSVSSGDPSTSVTTVGPSSSSGGPTSACENACDKSTSCGLDLCGQLNINCSAPLPGQVACPLNCVANASCGDIQKLAMQNFATPLGFCILGCQGGMGPGSSSVGPGSSGVGPGSSSSGIPPVAVCQQCTIQQCGNAVFACNAKKGPGSCSQWLQCAQSCGTDSMCLFGCDSQFPNAKPQYDAVYQCLCDKCDASCPSENACQHTGP